MTDPATENPPTQGYSIRVVSRLTGISADQLRVWERRYGFPAPDRDPNGKRVYSDVQVERLGWIRRAMEAGYRAGEAIAQPIEELQRLLLRGAALSPPATGHRDDVERVVALLRNDDVEGARNEVRRLITLHGPRAFVTEIAGRLAQRVGDGWATGELQVHHEHLFSEVLISQLRLLLATYDDGIDGTHVVLATLPNEQHTLGLEMAAVYLASLGGRVRLLGANAPPMEIAAAAKAFDARAVGLSVSVSADRGEVTQHLRALLRTLPEDVLVWVGGAHPDAFDLGDARVRRTREWSELGAAFASL